MNLQRTLLLVLAAAFAITAHANDCSGGAEGGTDATGNQCNEYETPVAQSAGLRSDVLREHGLVEYVSGHYASAIADFRNAATLGDRRSAEILVLMYRFGPRLYGEGVAADPIESARWAAVAVSTHSLPIASDKALSRAGR